MRPVWIWTAALVIVVLVAALLWHRAGPRVLAASQHPKSPVEIRIVETPTSFLDGLTTRYSPNLSVRIPFSTGLPVERHVLLRQELQCAVGTNRVDARRRGHLLSGRSAASQTVYDTFGITIKDSDGNPVRLTSGRDGSSRAKSVLLEPGARCCLSRVANLCWNPDGKTRTFVYRDGTGSWANYGPPAGSYTLSFWCKQKMEGPKDSKVAQWTGETETKDVAFQVVDP